MSNKDRSKRVDTGKKDEWGRPIYNWNNNTDKIADNNIINNNPGKDFDNDVIDIDDDITTKINIMEKELIPENNHTFGFNTVQWSDIRSLNDPQKTFYVKNLNEQEELEILKKIIKEKECSNKKEVIKSIDSIIKNIDNQNYDNDDLLLIERNPGDVFGFKKDMTEIKNKLLNIREKIKNDTTQEGILVSDRVLKQQFYPIVSRNKNYPVVKEEWENYVNNMGKIFNYYLSDPELNKSIRKISDMIDNQVKNNIAHHIYDTDYDNAQQLAIVYDTDLFDSESTSWEISNRYYSGLDFDKNKKIIHDMILNSNIDTLTTDHNDKMNKILDHFHTNCAPLETTIVSLKDIKKARDENSQYTVIVPLNLEDEKKINNYCNSNSFSRMFNNQEIEIINPDFNYVTTLNDNRSEYNSANGSLINKYIQEVYHEIEDEDPVKWMEYQNIVNTARELGKTRDGVYSDLQKSYIIKQKTKNLIEKISQERSKKMEENSTRKHIMSSVKEELSRDTNNITRNNDYVKELFDL